MNARKDERIQRCAEAQIRNLRKLFEHLDGQRRTLVETFHLLAGPVTRADLRQRFLFTKTRGFNTIAVSLFDSCILGVTRLVKQQKPPPLLFRLLKPFLKENQQNNAALLQILEAKYLD